MKASRPHCLRCHAELPLEGVEVAPPIWESLGLSQTNVVIIGVVAVILALGLLSVILRTHPVPVDEIARPVIPHDDEAPRTPPPARDPETAPGEQPPGRDPATAPGEQPPGRDPATAPGVPPATSTVPQTRGPATDPETVVDGKRNGGAYQAYLGMEPARAIKS
jgi:hypothetical protein